jgi:hypothetical protein
MSYNTNPPVESMPPDWIEKLLNDLGAPQDAANFTFFSDVFASEHGTQLTNPKGLTGGHHGGEYNPLNITSPPGWSDYNYNSGYPVQNYSSAQEGLAATTQFLHGSNYKQLLAALRSGESLPDILSTPRAGQWSGANDIGNPAGGLDQRALAAVAAEQQLGQNTPSNLITRIPSSSSKTGKIPQYALASQYPPTNDRFTNMMYSLNTWMNPHHGGFFGGVENVVQYIPIRVSFALGFGAVGVFALMGLVSGGNVSGKDVPGIVAGLVANPENRLNYLLQRSGISRPSATTQQNLALRQAAGQRAQERLALSQAAGQRAQESLNARIARSVQQQELEPQKIALLQRRESRMERRSSTRTERFRRLRLQEARERRLQAMMNLDMEPADMGADEE